MDVERLRYGDDLASLDFFALTNVATSSDAITKMTATTKTMPMTPTPMAEGRESARVNDTSGSALWRRTTATEDQRDSVANLSTMSKRHND